MSVYPRNLSNFLNRLSGYNKNNVKLTVLGSGTANDGDIIQVDLPSNSIVDLSSLAWSFNFATIAQAGAAAEIVIPTNIEGIVTALLYKAARAGRVRAKARAPPLLLA